MKSVRLLALRALPLAALLAALHLSPAWASEYDDVDALMRAGNNTEALAKANAFLESRPRDPQMRFLKGTLQSELGQRPEAIATLKQLTQDYPSLAEPFNNLAVLQAADGQWTGALESLEAAVRLNPSYTTAYENLGNVYIQLARASYARGAELDPANAPLRTKAERAKAIADATGAAKR
jgi:tetratricopeptide (TPR) repeat protein